MYTKTFNSVKVFLSISDNPLKISVQVKLAIFTSESNKNNLLLLWDYRHLSDDLNVAKSVVAQYL